MLIWLQTVYIIIVGRIWEWVPSISVRIFDGIFSTTRKSKYTKLVKICTLLGKSSRKAHSPAKILSNLNHRLGFQSFANLAQRRIRLNEEFAGARVSTNFSLSIPVIVHASALIFGLESKYNHLFICTKCVYSYSDKLSQNGLNSSQMVFMFILYLNLNQSTGARFLYYYQMLVGKSTIKIFKFVMKTWTISPGIRTASCLTRQKIFVEFKNFVVVCGEQLGAVIERKSRCEFFAAPNSLRMR